jgi:nuclear RNA export factor
MKINAFLNDEEMGGNELVQSSSGDRRRGGKMRNMRKGSPIPRGIGGGKLIQHPAGWYCATIHHGGKYHKDVILKLIMDGIAPKTLYAHYYKLDEENNVAQFYIDDYDVAEAVLRQDKKIDLPDGFKMSIRVRGSLPSIKVDNVVKEKMKMAMVKRYNLQTKALDLTKFHTDPDLSDVFCALFRQPIMSAVIEIISENIPDLEALNLNDNKLNMLDNLRVVATKLQNLKILYLGNNRVSK